MILHLNPISLLQSSQSQDMRIVCSDSFCFLKVSFVLHFVCSLNTGVTESPFLCSSADAKAIVDSVSASHQPTEFHTHTNKRTNYTHTHTEQESHSQ